MSLDTSYRSPFDAFAAAAERRKDAPFLLAPASAALPYAPEGFNIAYGTLKTDVDRLRTGIRRRRLWTRCAGRPVAGESPGLFSPLACAQRARCFDRSDQPRRSSGRVVVPARTVAGRSSGGCAGSHPSDERRRARARSPDRYRQPDSSMPDGRRRSGRRIQRRMRAAVHLRKHRQAEGVHAVEPLFSAGRRMVSRARRRGGAAAGPRGQPDAVADVPHERAGLQRGRHDGAWRRGGSARPLSCKPLVAVRGGQRRDRRPLSRRDPGHSAPAAGQPKSSGNIACVSRSRPASTCATARPSRSVTASRSSRPGR